METIKLKIWLENSLDACAFGEGGTNIVLQCNLPAKPLQNRDTWLKLQKIKLDGLLFLSFMVSENTLVLGRRRTAQNKIS